MNTASTPAFVIVKWEDAWADAVTAVTLKDVGETHKSECIETAGWLLKDDATGISLANEVCADKSYRGRTFIPKAMIVSVTHHTLAKPRKKKPQATEATEGAQ